MKIENHKRFVTPKAFRDPEFYNGIFSEASIRWLIFNAEQKKFMSCIKRLGRKILIDLDEFEAWIDSHGVQK